MKIVLETERLLIRRITEDDAEAFLIMESEPDVLRYIGRKPLPSVDDYRTKIRSSLLPYYEKPGGLAPGPWSRRPAANSAAFAACDRRLTASLQLRCLMGQAKSNWVTGYGSPAGAEGTPRKWRWRWCEKPSSRWSVRVAGGERHRRQRRLRSRP